VTSKFDKEIQGKNKNIIHIAYFEKDKKENAPPKT